MRFVLPAVLVFALCSSPASAAVILNGDFAAGLAQWTTFTTTNGVLEPTTESFDVDGDGQSSTAVRFEVGQAAFAEPDVHRGGGISQMFSSSGGLFTFAADIASFASETANNSGGRVQMRVNGVVVADHDFGPIGVLAVERATLSAIVALAPGNHQLDFLVTRPFMTLVTTPYQYIDDVTVTAEAVPEPTSLLLLGAALAGAAVRRRRA